MQSDMKFKVRETVISKAIGSCPEFNGIIVAKVDDHILDTKDRKIKVDGYYHVADAQGKLWHRVDSDLTKVINEVAD